MMTQSHRRQPPSRRAAHLARGRRAKRFSPKKILWIVLLSLLAIALIAAGVVAFTSREVQVSVDAEDPQLKNPFEDVLVSGRVGATPVVEVLGELSASSVKVSEIITGDGREITEGGAVVLSITAFDAATGEPVSKGAKPRLLVATADEENLDPDLLKIVLGRTEGSRLLALHPISTDEGDVAMELVVVDVLWSTAMGQESSVDEAAPVSVEMTPEGPKVSHDSAEPDGATVTLLVNGDGPQVSEDDTVVAQYYVVGWSDGKVRASTWSSGVPQLISLPESMKGLAQGVTDRRVGSRLVVTIPADQANGDDTLIIVIDIVGTQTAEQSKTESSDAATPQSH